MMGEPPSPAGRGASVSVVVPTFRRERAVVAAVRSALAQPNVQVQVIVLDDSAENSARGPIEAIGDGRVRYVPCTEPTGGVPARLRNRGLALAQGEFVHFLDDDDELEPGALEALTGALRARPDAGAAIGVITPVGLEGSAAVEHEQEYFTRAARRLRVARRRSDLVARLLFGDAPLTCSAVTARVEAARRVGGFSEDIPRAQDGEFILRLVRATGFAFVDRPVVRYQTGAPSLIHADNLRPLLNLSYQLMHDRYRQAHGNLEYLALRLLAAWQHIREIM